MPMAPLTDEMKTWLVDNDWAVETWTDAELWEKAIADAAVDGSLPAETFKQLMQIEDDLMPDPTTVFGGNKAHGNGSGLDVDIRVKAPSEQYCEKRYAAKNRFGQEVWDPINRRQALTLSEGAKARHGVLLKHLANRSGLVSCPLSEHEKGLLAEMAEKATWAGDVNGEHYDAINSPAMTKALIDDATSGGLEIAPIEFDDDLITFPLLYGELYPQVEIKQVDRGRRIEGASITTPTMSWGGIDDTAIPLFTTTSMVAPIDTTIFRVEGALEVGRDLLGDSPVNIGNELTALVGMRLQAELDEVIAAGDGTTQPEGLFTKSGVSTVTPDNTTTGPPTLDDYLDLMFAVAKQYRKQNLRPCFVSNDTTYQRSKAIRVDPAATPTDQRPVMSPLTQVNDYRNLGWPHKVENNIGNSTAGFFALGKYRLYRRAGMTMRFVEGGKDLARRNMLLLVYMSRWGGQLMDASAGAKWTNGQS